MLKIILMQNFDKYELIGSIALPFLQKVGTYDFGIIGIYIIEIA